MQLLLIRHGETEWSSSHRQTGLTDVGLTQVGFEQATRTAALISHLSDELGPPATIYSSPLSRAAKTAELVFGSGAAIIENPHIVEIDFGHFEGLTSGEVHRSRPGWSVWCEPCPGGETIDDVGARADTFLTTIRDEAETIAVVSHGIFIRVLAARAVGLPASAGGVLTIDTGGIGIIADVRNATVIQKWNLTSQDR